MVWVKVIARVKEEKEGEFFIRIGGKVDPSNPESLKAAAERAVKKQLVKLGSLEEGFKTYMVSLPSTEIYEYYYGDDEQPDLEKPIGLQADEGTV